MIEAFVGMLRHHPEVTFFLVLGIGYVLGKVRLGSFTLGAVTGTLLAGVAGRPAGREGVGRGEAGLLPPVPVFHRLQDGAAILPRPQERRPQQAALAAIVATTGLVVAYT